MTSPPRPTISGTAAIALGAVAGGARWFTGPARGPLAPVLRTLRLTARSTGLLALPAGPEEALHLAYGAGVAGARSLAVASDAAASSVLERALAERVPIVGVRVEGGGRPPLDLDGPTFAPGDPVEAFEAVARALDAAEVERSPVLLEIAPSLPAARDRVDPDDLPWEWPIRRGDLVFPPFSGGPPDAGRVLPGFPGAARYLGTRGAGELARNAEGAGPLRTFGQALADLGRDPANGLLVGADLAWPDRLELYGLSAPRGWAVSVAAGAALAHPDLDVVAVDPEPDLASVAVERGVDLVILVPARGGGVRSEAADRAIEADLAFVARVRGDDPATARSLLARALEHPGPALLDVVGGGGDRPTGVLHTREVTTAQETEPALSRGALVRQPLGISRELGRDLLRRMHDPGGP